VSSRKQRFELIEIQVPMEFDVFPIIETRAFDTCVVQVEPKSPDEMKRYASRRAESCDGADIVRYFWLNQRNAHS
jgi:hypothetical protein